MRGGKKGGFPTNYGKKKKNQINLKKCHPGGKEKPSVVVRKIFGKKKGPSCVLRGE